jgi:hypothetical protein
MKHSSYLSKAFNLTVAGLALSTAVGLSGCTQTVEQPLSRYLLTCTLPNGTDMNAVFTVNAEPQLIKESGSIGLYASNGSTSQKAILVGVPDTSVCKIVKEAAAISRPLN